MTTDTLWLERVRQELENTPLVIFEDFTCPDCGFSDTSMIWPANIPEVKGLIAFAKEYRKRARSMRADMARGITPDDTRALDEMAKQVLRAIKELDH